MEHHDNQQLHRIFTKKKSFYRDMEKVSKRYFEFQQLVYYLPIKDINPDMIKKLDGEVELKNNHSKRREDIYIINGQYQPQGEKNFEKLILQLVQTIPRPHSAFGIIYINTLADGQAYNDFKKVLQLLPIQYLINLTKIYVLNASFFNKAFSWLSFGVAISYINKKTINVENLRELSQQSHVQMGILKQYLPANVIKALLKSQNPVREHKHHGICVPEAEHIDKSKKIRHETIATNFSAGGMGRTKSADTAIQGFKPAHPGKSLSDYELGPTGAPIILEMLICFFNNKEEYLKEEGLFRKSVSIEDETQILQELNKRNYNYLESVTDPHVIANAIKRFLCNLAIPVIPFDVFEEFMTNDSSPHFNQIVVQRIKSLPKVNRMIIFLLFDFLANKVVPYSEFSKMGTSNLCIVFGPCLMRSEVASIKDLIFAKKIITATHIIFVEFQNIFGGKVSQMKLKRNSYKQYRISELKQRESRDSKQSSPAKLAKQESSSSSQPQRQQDQSPQTPTFQAATLLNRTSLFIKQTLEEVESEDQFDEVQKEESIHPLQQTHPEQPKEQQINQNKLPLINLFITPKVTQDPPYNPKAQSKDLSGRIAAQGSK